MMAPRYFEPKLLRHDDGGRAVRCTDDRNGRRVVEIEEDRGQAQRKEDTELRCCAEDHQLRIGKQRPEVYHRADADEQDQREQLVVNASFEQRNQRAARLHGVHTRTC